MIRLSGLLLALLFASTTSIPAQSRRDLEDAEVIIEKNREIILPQKNKVIPRIPPEPRRPEPSRSLPFSFVNVTPEFKPIPLEIKPTRYREQPPAGSNEPENEIKIGAGNFLSLYGEGQYRYRAGRHVDLLTHVYHRSAARGPIDDENSGNSLTRLNVSGQLKKESFTLNNTLGLQRRTIRYYGYPSRIETPSDDEIRVAFSTVSLQTAFEHTGRNTNLEVYNQLNQFFSSDDLTEFTWKPAATLLFNTGENQAIGTKLTGLVGSYSPDVAGVSSLSRVLIQAEPFYQRSFGRLSGKAGLRVAYQNDTLASEQAFKVFPLLHASYRAADWLTLQAGVDGGIIDNTVRSLSDDNNFVSQRIVPVHTHQNVRFYFNFDLNLFQALNLSAGVAVESLRYLPFYLNIVDAPYAFNAVYNRENLSRTNPFLEAGINLGSGTYLFTRFDYFNYQLPDHFIAPYHQPEWEWAFNTAVPFGEKLSLEGNITVLGGIETLELSPFGVVNPVPDPDITPSLNIVSLDPVIDTRLSLRYAINSRFTAFLEGLNLLNKENVRYFNYPSRGFQVLGGMGFTF